MSERKKYSHQDQAQYKYSDKKYQILVGDNQAGQLGIYSESLMEPKEIDEFCSIISISQFVQKTNQDILGD